MSQVDTYQIDDKYSFKIAPTWGCNIFSWIVDGKEIMFCPEGYPEAAFKITGGGNPTLLPSVGRTWDHTSGKPVLGNYRIYGIDKDFYMPNHGILFLCKWNKIEEIRTDGSVTVAYELVIPEEVKANNYPFDLGFTHKYTLSRDGIKLEATITNNDSTPIPAAFGYHPFFRISNPDREGIEIRIPVTRHLELTPDTNLLTGESEPTDGVFTLKPGIDYDEAFGNATGSRMSLIDRKAGHSIHVDFDKKCELFFMWSPADSDFICIEPWTRGLGAFESMKDRGWESNGLIPILQSGEIERYEMAFSVEDFNLKLP